MCRLVEYYKLPLNKGLTMKPTLARIVFFVRDAASLAEWYRGVFGLTTNYDGLDQGWIELDAGGSCTLALHTLDGPEPAHAEIAFAVDDVEATRQELIGKGGDEGSGSCWRQWGSCVAAGR